ncbi:MAG TPA: DUF2844 domain-containing protein [Geobacteraceae bacterium]
MKRRLCPWIFCLALAVSFFSISPQVHATLGEPAASVEADRKALSAVRRATTTVDGYTVQEVKSDANTVREYVSSSGVVFAIAWNGLSHPDLTPLLGSYAGEYRKALRQVKPRTGRRFSQVKGSGVVVETWGHMRNFRGRAYAPALLPAGVTVDEIK